MAASLQRHSSSRRLIKAAAHGHSRCDRTGNRGNLARGAACGVQAPGKGGSTGLLGFLGPHPWLFEVAEPLPALIGHRCRHRGARVPDPRAEPMLTDSGVLGSPPWLFVNLLKSRAAAHHKTALAVSPAEEGAYQTTVGHHQQGKF